VPPTALDGRASQGKAMAKIQYKIQSL